MRKISLFISFILFTIVLSSFKIEEGVIWLTNYDDAIAMSKKENKPILMSFSGSDWCANCMRLDKVVFDSEAFKKYSIDNFVLLNLDFPARRKNKLSKEMTRQNEYLAEKFNKSGAVPAVIIINGNEEILASVIGYKTISADAYIENIKLLLK